MSGTGKQLKHGAIQNKYLILDEKNLKHNDFLYTYSLWGRGLKLQGFDCNNPRPLAYKEMYCGVATKEVQGNDKGNLCEFWHAIWSQWYCTVNESGCDNKIW